MRAANGRAANGGGEGERDRRGAAATSCAVPAPAGTLDPIELPPVEDFLSCVGRRVRERRALMHMTRRALAARSGVSERYLAQLEGGRGNMSIALLRKVAGALCVPMAEIVAEEAGYEEDALVAAGAAAVAIGPVTGADEGAATLGGS